MNTPMSIRAIKFQNNPNFPLLTLNSSTDSQETLYSKNSPNGFTDLHIALMINNKEKLNEILKSDDLFKSQILQKDKNEISPLVLALLIGNTDFFDKSIEKMNQSNIVPPWKEMIINAIDKNDYESFKHLIEKADDKISLTEIMNYAIDNHEEKLSSFDIPTNRLDQKIMEYLCGKNKEILNEPITYDTTSGYKFSRAKYYMMPVTRALLNANLIEDDDPYFNTNYKLELVSQMLSKSSNAYDCPSDIKDNTSNTTIEGISLIGCIALLMESRVFIKKLKTLCEENNIDLTMPDTKGYNALDYIILDKFRLRDESGSKKLDLIEILKSDPFSKIKTINDKNYLSLLEKFSQSADKKDQAGCRKFLDNLSSKPIIDNKDIFTLCELAIYHENTDFLEYAAKNLDLNSLDKLSRNKLNQAAQCYAPR